MKNYQVWVPTKGEIEDMLWLVHQKLKNAKTVSEVASGMEDELLEVSCHISNRAMEEKNDRPDN
jgi:hypothetical protein